MKIWEINLKQWFVASSHNLSLIHNWGLTETDNNFNEIFFRDLWLADNSARKFKGVCVSEMTFFMPYSFTDYTVLRLSCWHMHVNLMVKKVQKYCNIN